MTSIDNTYPQKHKRAQKKLWPLKTQNSFTASYNMGYSG